MNYFGPSEHCYVCFMSKQEAERFDRRIYNVAKTSRLGWTPYTIRVLYQASLPHTAFSSMKAFKQWLGPEFKVVMPKRNAFRRIGFRDGFIRRKATA